ncbi:hypothetical protein BDD12DRAFT_896205 [Trichophaea hybrida]|nr:hypothetical protein BDD12DRAFT_896205 [Trichophaea hybrida]
MSNTEPAPPNTNATPPTAPSVLHFYHITSVTSLRSYNPTSAVTSIRSFHRISAVAFHCSETMIDTIEFPLLYINSVESGNMDRIVNDCIRHGQPLNIPYTSRTDTENYELVRSVTNKWNRQYGDKKMLSEDIIEALIHCINLDYIHNAATKAKRQMALANGKQASPFDNEDVSPAP